MFLAEIRKTMYTPVRPTMYVFSRNKKNNVYPCKPQFYYIKVGFKGVKFIYACFCDVKVKLVDN